MFLKVKFLLVILSLFMISCNSIEENSFESSNFSSSITFETKQEIDNYYNFSSNITLYLNPSVQYQNSYYDNIHNEGVIMNNISLVIEQYLTTHSNLTIYSNNNLPGLSLKQSVFKSNNLNVDYHVALHSNAGGGNGYEIWYNQSSYEFTTEILTSLENTLPFKNRGLKDGSTTLYELKNTNSKACLIEILFHDEPKQANYILDNIDNIAKAIATGILNYLEIYH